MGWARAAELPHMQQAIHPWTHRHDRRDPQVGHRAAIPACPWAARTSLLIPRDRGVSHRPGRLSASSTVLFGETSCARSAGTAPGRHTDEAEGDQQNSPCQGG
jgi:hypothetical protein